MITTSHRFNTFILVQLENSFVIWNIFLSHFNLLGPELLLSYGWESSISHHIARTKKIDIISKYFLFSILYSFCVNLGFVHMVNATYEEISWATKFLLQYDKIGIDYPQKRLLYKSYLNNFLHISKYRFWSTRIWSFQISK